MERKDTITVINLTEPYRGYDLRYMPSMWLVYKDRQLVWEAVSKTAAKFWIDQQIQTATKPDAGDLVLHEKEDTNIKPGSYGIIEGIAGRAVDSDGEVMVCFNARAFLGPKNKYDEGPEFCSCSGGPAWYIPIDQLTNTDTTKVHWFWKWKDYPRGGGGAEYQREVNVWSYERPEREVS